MSRVIRWTGYIARMVEIETNYIELSPSWEADSSQFFYIPQLSWDLSVILFVYKCREPDESGPHAYIL